MLRGRSPVANVVGDLLHDLARALEQLGEEADEIVQIEGTFAMATVVARVLPLMCLVVLTRRGATTPAEALSQPFEHVLEGLIARSRPPR